ncbi:MFS transporter [Dongia sp.]|uniref:MFS transporter n=1 Tax=Dongia sp. TaxID=1977262 RepID=UPI0035B4B31F
MRAPLFLFLPALIAVAGFETALALVSPLISLRLEEGGVSTGMIGFVASAYSIGYLGGTQVCRHLILQFGARHTIALLATVAALSLLAHAVLFNVLFWLLLSGLCGFAMAGIYTIAESLLNILASRGNRGRLYSVYMTASWLTAGASPVAVLAEGSGGIVSFIVAGALVALTTLPVLVSRRAELPVPAQGKLTLRHFRAVPPVALAICFGSGIINGGLHGLLPSYAVETGLSNGDLSLLLTVAAIAGIAGQFPIGHLSDRVRERLSVAKGIVFLGLALCSGMALFGNSGLPMLVTFLGLLTAIMAPIYGIGAALANDRAHGGCTLATTGALLFVNGIGAALGPLGAGFAMEARGPTGLFLFLALASAAVGLVTACHHRLERIWVVAR